MPPLPPPPLERPLTTVYTRNEYKKALANHLSGQLQIIVIVEICITNCSHAQYITHGTRGTTVPYYTSYKDCWLLNKNLLNNKRKQNSNNNNNKECLNAFC